MAVSILYRKERVAADSFFGNAEGAFASSGDQGGFLSARTRCENRVLRGDHQLNNIPAEVTVISDKEFKC